MLFLFINNHIVVLWWKLTSYASITLKDIYIAYKATYVFGNLVTVKL